MSMRIQEVHPAVVHFPIALFPTAIAADLLGRLADNQSLCDAGRRGVALAAGSAVLSAATGAIAQETVKVDGYAHDLLVAHRNLNLGFLALATGMAVYRSSSERPGGGYLALGLAGIGLVTYSAYLGGHMVYEYGVAVKAAGTVKEEQAPLLRAKEIARVGRVTVRNLWDGLRHTVEGLAQGQFVPVWTNGHKHEGEEK